MIKPSKKERTCKYNLNRDSADIAFAYCTWREQFEPIPPHLVFVSRGMQSIDCRRCKAYEKFKTNGNVD